MAVILWPADAGYAEFAEMPHRSRGPHVHRSVYTGAVHVSYGGGRRRRGYVVTPVQTATGAIQASITAMVQAIADPRNQLSLDLPRRSTGTAQSLTVLVTGMRPPERTERGVWRGWRIDWIDSAGVSSDTAAPTLSSATVTGRTLVLTYSEALSPAHVPRPADYVVRAGGADPSRRVFVAVSTVALAGAALTLTLASVVTTGQTVTITEAAAGIRVRDAAGNLAARLVGQAVTNRT